MSITLLRYPGGKSRAINILKEYLEDDDKEICSPFFGGGAFELYCSQVKKIHVNAYDLFQPLINFWQCVKKNPDKLVDKINNVKQIFDKENFYKVRENLFDDTINKYKRASYFFALNRSSFSGTTLSGGFSKQAEEKRFTTSSINKIKNIDLSNVEFDCLSFSESIKLNPDRLLFLDPPYYLENSVLYGNKGDLHKNFKHKKLFEILDNRDNWILCYNNCDFIKNLYSDYHIDNASWSYSMTSNESSEIIITTY